MRHPGNPHPVPPTARQARNLGRHGNPTYNQAAKIVARLGGEAATAQLLGLSHPTPYKWQYASPYGRDGLIPSSMVARINDAAARIGVVLTPQDWAPELNPSPARPVGQTASNLPSSNISIDDLLS